MTIDIKKPFEFYFKSKKWLVNILSISFFVILIYSIIILGYFAFFASLAPAVSFDSTGFLSFGFLIFCFAWIFFFILLILFELYTKGLGIKVYKSLRSSKQNIYSIDQLPAYEIVNTSITGLKYIILQFFYQLPIILAYVFCILFTLVMAFFIPFISQDKDVQEATGVIIIIVFYMALFGLAFFQMVYSYVVAILLKPVLYETIYKFGFMKAFNFMQMFKILKRDLSTYFFASLYNLLFYVAWVIIYYLVSFLVFLCIGIVAIPFIIGLYYIISMYLEPYLYFQVWSVVDNLHKSETQLER